MDGPSEYHASQEEKLRIIILHYMGYDTESNKRTNNNNTQLVNTDNNTVVTRRKGLGRW